jgi:putative peptidoglycan lipid II flippase
MANSSGEENSLSILRTLSPLFSRLRQSRLVHGGLIVGGGILLGNISGFFRSAVTAYLLGTHARADALAVALGPLDNLNSIIVNTMLFAFVPMLMLRQEGERAALFARSARVFSVVLLAFVGATVLFAPQVVAGLGPGLAAPQRDQAVQLLRFLAPATWFAGCAGIFSALLYTERRFLVPALYQTCLNAGTIAGALLLRSWMGINGFAIGYTAGAALQLLLTWWFSRGLRRRTRSSLAFPLAEVLSKPGMFLAYAALIAGNLLVTRIFATHAGPGMAAAFDYCIRCVNVVIAYLVYPVASSLVPEIARLRGANHTPRAYSLIDRGMVLMTVAAVASCAIGVLLRTPVIALLFERGNFTPESTRLVAGVFMGFAPSLIGWALLDLIARCFFALDRPRLPLIAAFIPVTLNFAISSVLLARGKLMDPTMLGLGASIGFLAGFAALFTMTHLRRSTAKLEPSFVEVE